MKIKLHKGDLPANLNLGPLVAIDSETLGLNPFRDRLCLAQLSAGDGVCHAVQFAPGEYAAPNLKKLLTDPAVTKLFHFARFDVAMFRRHLGVVTAPIYCTKIASKLVRTYTDKHGLKDLVKELLGVDLSKEQQSSDWGAPVLTEKQLAYAANDVAFLHKLKEALDGMLAREHRTALARACFDFLPTRAELDLAGWGRGGYLRALTPRRFRDPLPPRRSVAEAGGGLRSDSVRRPSERSELGRVPVAPLGAKGSVATACGRPQGREGENQVNPPFTLRNKVT